MSKIKICQKLQYAGLQIILICDKIKHIESCNMLELQYFEIPIIVILQKFQYIKILIYQKILIHWKLQWARILESPICWNFDSLGILVYQDYKMMKCPIIQIHVVNSSNSNMSEIPVGHDSDDSSMSEIPMSLILICWNCNISKYW